MKNKNLLRLLLCAMILQVALFTNAQTVTAPADYGSMLGVNSPFYVQGDYTTLKPTTLNWKIVSIGGTTWTWFQTVGTAVTNGADWAMQLRYKNDACGGAQEKQVPVASRLTTGTSTEAWWSGVSPDASHPKITYFAEVAGMSETECWAYNPNAATVYDASDLTAPTFNSAANIVTGIGTVAITLDGADNSGHYFYFVKDKNDNFTVSFTNTVNLTFPVSDSKQDYYIWVADFSGNISDYQLVKTYDDSLVELAAPTGLAFQADNATLTFNPVPNASSYNAFIFLGDFPVYTQNDVLPAGSLINYTTLPTTYTVKVQAVGDGTAYSDSEMAEINWVIPGDLPMSNYCGAEITGNGSNVNLSVETQENGDIWVTIHGDTWRGNGAQLAGFTVNGRSGAEVLDEISAGAANPQVFRPKAGVTFGKGLSINYNGTMEWTAGGGWATKQFFTNYIYGTTCAETEAPVIVSASVSGEARAASVNISVEATDNVGVAQIKLADAANAYEQTLPAQTGAAIYLFSGLQSATTYNFTVTAIDLAGNESAPTALAPYTTLALPNLVLSSSELAFSPTAGTKKVTVSGTNIASDLIFTAPAGYTVSPATISPEADGSVPATEVTVTWVYGLGNNVVITGGGLESPAVIALTSSSFSEFCSYVITQNGAAALTTPALLNIGLSEDKTVLTYKIAPYDITGDARWNANSLGADIILLNGSAPAVAPVRAMTDNNHTITLTFADALTDGDVITYAGTTLVWTTTGYTNYGNNANCYINSWNKPYTVGLASCDLGTPGTDIDELVPGDAFAFYPNPATDAIHFTAEVKEVNLYSLQGQLVLSQTNVQSLNVSALAKGLYIVKATDNAGKNISSKVEIR